MSWHDLVTTNLPPPSESEPANLRRDILDELSDHLECATRREMRQIDDPEMARDKALERFGSPEKIARQLWLDAMKEQLMNQRIMIGTQLLTVIAMVALCMVVVMALRQNQRVQEALLAKLESSAAATSNDTAFHWPTFRIQVKSAGTGAGLANVKASLSGQPYRDGEQTSLPATTDSEGKASFGPLRPGVYNLWITSSKELPATYHRSVTVPPGDQPAMKIEWPASQNETVSKPIQTNVPADPEGFRQIMVLALEKTIVDSVSGGKWGSAPQMIAIAPGNQVALVPDGHPLVKMDYGSVASTEEVNKLAWSNQVTLDPFWKTRIQQAFYWIGPSDLASTVKWEGLPLKREYFESQEVDFDKEGIDLNLNDEHVHTLAKMAQDAMNPSPPRQRATTRPR